MTPQRGSSARRRAQLLRDPRGDGRRRDGLEPDRTHRHDRAEIMRHEASAPNGAVRSISHRCRSRPRTRSVSASARLTPTAESGALPASRPVPADPPEALQHTRSKQSQAADESPHASMPSGPSPLGTQVKSPARDSRRRKERLSHLPRTKQGRRHGVVEGRGRPSRQCRPRDEDQPSVRDRCPPAADLVGWRTAPYNVHRSQRVVSARGHCSVRAMCPWESFPRTCEDGS
jgi:hypothetical protein